MKTSMKFLTTSLVLPFAVGACGTFRDNDRTVSTRDTASERSDSVVYENEGERLTSTTLSFNRGSAVLTPQARRDLRNLVSAAKTRGDIEDIKVAVWSDKGLPMTQDQELSKADRDLADKRADAIEDYLEDELDTPSVELFSMAERANWVARFFNTDEAELRSSFARRSDRGSEAKHQILRKGSPSKAVVLIETELD